MLWRKIIPNRGAWLEIETDSNKVLWVRIDRKRKVAVTSLLRAFGYSSDEELIKLFKDVDLPIDKNDKEEKLSLKRPLKDAAKDSAEGLQEVIVVFVRVI